MAVSNGTNGACGTNGTHGLDANGHGANGHDSNGHATNGHATNGHATNGHATNGHATNGHATNGHAINGHATNSDATSEHAITERPKAAFITGINGQDGSYLTEILLDKGYQVHGLVRPSSQRRQALARPMRQGVTLHFGDVCDGARMVEILCKIEVDEIYHLAAQSHVGASFETPLATCETNAMGTLRLLEAMRVLKLCDKVRFYNACSSELFGADSPAPQTEETPFHPHSPYAVSKLFQFWSTVNFREAYGLHGSNGILFNHESPRRGTTFVTRKITTQVALIATGQIEYFELGNVNSTRDWGHSKDYMRGAYLMLQQPQGGDFILATGHSYSVRDFVNSAFDVVGIKIEWSGAGLDEVATEVATGKVRVRINPAFYRQLDVENLSGSAAKANRVLGWEPEYSFKMLVEEMMLSDMEKAKAGRLFASSYLDWLAKDSIEAIKAAAISKIALPTH